MSERARIVEVGPWGSVQYAQRTNGAMEAKEWIDNHGGVKQCGFSVLFKRMAETGKIWNKEHFRQLSENIYEFKKRSDRILTFRVNNAWYLTHHYPKARMKCPPEQIERSEEIRKEFLELLNQEGDDV